MAAKIDFPNYNMYSGIELFHPKEEQSGFDIGEINRYSPKASAFVTNIDPNPENEDELKARAKEMELKKISDEIEKISDEYQKLQLSGNYFEAGKLRKKNMFLTFKLQNLEKCSYKYWKYSVEEILEDLTDKIVPKKKSYDTKDILIIANVLAKIFKNQTIKSHVPIMKNIQKYIKQFGNIRFFSNFANIFDDDTLQLLLKSLSYFVKLEKVEYISIILQAIDIFSSNKSLAFDLYKEIIKIGDPEQYEMIYNKKEDETFGIEANPKVFFDELKDKLEEKSLNTNTQKLFKTKQVLTFIDQLYDYLDKFYESKTKKTGGSIVSELKVLYIWRCTLIIDKTSKREIINWSINNEEEIPERSHPKYSQYVNLFEFAKFVVNDNKFFLARELLFNAPQLEGLESTPSPKQSFGCWNGVNQKVKDAKSIVPQAAKPNPPKPTRIFKKIDCHYYDDHEEYTSMSDFEDITHYSNDDCENSYEY
jgi:hypothetical protein